MPFDDVPSRHTIDLSDGDRLVLHENRPSSWTSGDPALMLVHGLAGCHGSPYMIRLAKQFFDRGVRVFRLDSRGCGAGAMLAREINHAGRSDDVIAALDEVCRLGAAGPIWAAGVSLGANQLLRAFGQMAGGLCERREWFDQVERIAAVAPPCDLQACSDNLNRWILRPYSTYFIRSLLGRVTPPVREREDFQKAIQRRRPKTLQELDEWFTAPMSGFAGASDYYAQSSACRVTAQITTPALVVAAKDDPMVPVRCFTEYSQRWSQTTKLLISKGGGHVGFRTREGGYWVDQVLGQWFGP